MHACLAVPEIVEVIADFANETDVFDHQTSWLARRRTPSTACALARTCRSFYDPASNILWRDLPSFRPLLNLILPPRTEGQDASKESANMVVLPLEAFLKLGDASSWARFLTHARRVRKLRSQWTWDMISYLNVLERCRPDREVPLLPGLQDLTCVIRHGVSDANRPMAVLSHPGLLALKIVYGLYIADTPSFDFLRSKAPMLRTLEIDCYDRLISPSSYLHSLPPSLHNLNNLATFLYSHTPLPPATLMHLAKLPGLKIIVARILPGSVVSFSKRDPLFQALESLTLMGGDGEDVAHVLDGIQSPNLTTLRLKCKTTPTCSLIARWARLVGSRRSVERLTVHYHKPPRSETPSHCVVDDLALQPLLELPALKSLCLPDTPLQLRSSFIQDLAILCPCLEKLVLGSRVRWRTTGLTMESLNPLSLHCSKLYVLSVTMIIPSAPAQVDQGGNTSARRWRWRSSARRKQTVRILPDFVTVEYASKVKCTRLKHLDIGYSTVEDPITFAAFIFNHFPNVREISDFGDFEYRTRLKKPNNLLKQWGHERWQRDISTMANQWDICSAVDAVIHSF